MKKSYRILILLSLVLVLLSCACGPPTEQIQATQTAMDQAKEERAEEFAANEWTSAKQSWDQAQSALGRKDYTAANTLLLRAKMRFEKARDLAKGRRDEMLKEVTNLQKTVEIRYGNAKAAIEKAKLSTRQKAEIEDACKEIDQAIEKLKTQINNGDLAPAKYTAQTTLHSVYNVEQMIQGKKAM